MVLLSEDWQAEGKNPYEVSIPVRTNCYLVHEKRKVFSIINLPLAVWGSP